MLHVDHLVYAITIENNWPRPGVLNKVLYREAGPRGPTPFPFIYHFGRKGTLLYTPPPQKKLKLKILSFCFYQVTVIFKHISASSVHCFVLKIEHWVLIHNAWHWHCFLVTCYVYKNMDSPYVFKFWVTNIMLREVPNVFKLTERRNVLREPK